MPQNDDFEAIGHLYDAALGHADWSTAGDRLTALVDGATLTLTAQYSPQAAVDMIDMRGLFTAINYQGTNPVADGYVSIESDGAGGTKITFDPDAAGTADESQVRAVGYDLRIASRFMIVPEGQPLRRLAKQYPRGCVESCGKFTLKPGEAAFVSTTELFRLDAYTGGVAYQAFADDRRVLAVGAPADLVWLSADPRTADPMTLRHITVEGTWLAGERTY